MLVKYKSFLVRDLFDIHPTKAYKLTNKQLFVKDGKVPVVTNTSEKHGRSGFSNLKPTEKNIITFSDTGTKSPDSFFYQEGEFIGYAHVQGMYPKTDDWNRLSLIYLTAILRKKTSGLYDYSTKMTREIILSMEIELPVKSDGEIDYKYMEDCISEIEESGKRALSEALVKEKIYSKKLTMKERSAIESINSGIAKTKKIRVKELFVIKGNPQLNKDCFVFSDNAKYPYFTRTVFNNGILGYVEYLDDVHLIKGNAIAVGMLGMKFFYMEKDFYAGQFTKTLVPKFKGFDEDIALFFITMFNKFSEIYLGGLVRDFEKLVYNTELEVPVIDNQIDIELIKNYIRGQKKLIVKNLNRGV